MRLHLLSVLFCAVALCSMQHIAIAQNSVPASLATEPANKLTTLTENDALMILLPLAEKVVDSSLNTDAQLKQLNEQKRVDDAQRLIERQQRQFESSASAKALSEQSAKAAQLQNWHADFLKQLGDFSGSEDEKHAVALAALSTIQRQARAMQIENTLLKLGSSLILGGAVVYFGGHAAGLW